MCQLVPVLIYKIITTHCPLEDHQVLTDHMQILVEVEVDVHV